LAEKPKLIYGLLKISLLFNFPLIFGCFNLAKGIIYFAIYLIFLSTDDNADRRLVITVLRRWLGRSKVVLLPKGNGKTLPGSPQK